jgi:hypothetical protein
MKSHLTLLVALLLSSVALAKRTEFIPHVQSGSSMPYKLSSITKSQYGAKGVLDFNVARDVSLTSQAESLGQETIIT